MKYQAAHQKALSDAINVSRETFNNIFIFLP